MWCKGEIMDINMVLGGQDSVLLANSPDQAVSRHKHPCEDQVNDNVLRMQNTILVSILSVVCYLF